MSALNSYMSQYAALNAEITSGISKVRRSSSASGNDGQKELAQVEKGFEEMDELFEQMELEIRELGTQSEQERCTNQLTSFKAEWKRLRDEYEAARRKCLSQIERDNLLGTSREPIASSGGSEDFAANDSLPESVAHTQRLLDNTETMERSSRKLEQGHQLLVESEQVGVSILNDLSLQREVLIRSRNRLRDTDDDLGTSSRVLTGMIMAIRQSKIILIFVFLVIIGLIILAVYFSFEG